MRFGHGYTLDQYWMVQVSDTDKDYVNQTIIAFLQVLDTTYTVS